MKKVLLLLLGLLLTGCSTTYHLSTVGHDPIYDTVLEVPADVQIDTLNYRQLQWKLRNDFQFRYDFAQYALSQPRSFDWNNRILGYNYNWSNRYWWNNYNYYWNRDMMWHDWVWGYPYSNWGFNSRPYWGWNNSYYYGWNNYGWNNWGWNNYGWNNWGWRQEMNDYAWHNRNRSNTAYVNGRRGSNTIENRGSNTIENRVVANRNRPRVNVDQNNVDRIANELRERINNKPIRVYNNPNNPNINNNSKPRVNNNPNPVRGYGRPEINNNNSSNIYTRPSTNTNNSTVRPSSTISRGNSSSRGGNSNRRN